MNYFKELMRVATSMELKQLLASNSLDEIIELAYTAESSLVESFKTNQLVHETVYMDSIKFAEFPFTIRHLVSLSEFIGSANVGCSEPDGLDNGAE